MEKALDKYKVKLRGKVGDNEGKRGEEQKAVRQFRGPAERTGRVSKIFLNAQKNTVPGALFVIENSAFSAPSGTRTLDK